MRKLFDKLYKEDENSFYTLLENNLKKDKKTFIVTANPETFMKSLNDLELSLLLNDKNTLLLPDGIGIVKAAKILDYDIVERITGIDVTIKLLEMANNLNKSIYLFGSKQEIIDLMIIRLKEDYPNIKIVGATNGYVTDKNSVFDEMASLSPDIVLVALGVPLQEKLIYKNINKFKKGIFMGVGGSFDVISGSKKRAPTIFIKLNLEWLYRIVREPKRIKRFYESNIKFMFKIKKYK